MKCGLFGLNYVQLNFYPDIKTKFVEDRGKFSNIFIGFCFFYLFPSCSADEPGIDITFSHFFKNMKVQTTWQKLAYEFILNTKCVGL